MKIFIDPGHNYSGYDTGAQGNNLREQDITFQVAQKLSKLLTDVGVEIKMSRNKITDNVGTSLTGSINGRINLANNFKADYFISLHCDSATSSSAKGSHICVYKKDSVAGKMANSINPYLLNIGLEGRSELIVARTDLGVLKGTNMPAILIEMGFISNSRDANIQKNKQDELANAIFKGVCDFVGISYDKKVEPVNDDITIKIDGVAKDIQYTNINGTVYAPIRSLCETLSYVVEWDDKTRTINVSTLKDSVETPKVEAAQTPINNPEPYKYKIIGTTHVVEIDPRNIFHIETQTATNQTSYSNFVNSLFFMAQANGKMFPQGMAVNAGQILSNYATHGKPVATLIVHSANDVEMKYVSDISKEENVWFAVSGYGIYPKITASSEGFTGIYSDVLRATNRPIIGYRKSDNKIVIAVRANTSSERASQTAKNLNLDFAISLDAGGSTTLKVDNKYKFKGDGRKLWGGIAWS